MEITEDNQSCYFSTMNDTITDEMIEILKRFKKNIPIAKCGPISVIKKKKQNVRIQNRRRFRVNNSYTPVVNGRPLSPVYVPPSNNVEEVSANTFTNGHIDEASTDIPNEQSSDITVTYNHNPLAYNNALMSILFPQNNSRVVRNLRVPSSWNTPFYVNC